jgi:hypothetical protein
MRDFFIMLLTVADFKTVAIPLLILFSLIISVLHGGGLSPGLSSLPIMPK